MVTGKEKWSFVLKNLFEGTLNQIKKFAFIAL